MDDLRAAVTAVRDTLASELGDWLLALYLFGSAARGEYVPGFSDVDLLLVVDPQMTLAAARNAFRPLMDRHGEVLAHGPLVATLEDLALHLALFPSLHRAIITSAFRLCGEPVLKNLPPPPTPDPLEEVAYAAASAVEWATALTPDSLPPAELRRLTRSLHRLAQRTPGSAPRRVSSPLEAILAIHAKLRELAHKMPQFQWQGAPPSGDLPDLLPGCLAFYQREKHLIAVLERVDERTLSRVDWAEVAAAADDAGARFGLATPWQLRLAATRIWVDSLYFDGFERVWGVDVLNDLEVDEVTLLRQLARAASEQRVEKVPMAYLAIDDAAVSGLIHDTQNVLLNAGLRAELFARLSGRPFDLPDWTPPGRGVPQPERVTATWERWRQLTAYYGRMWKAARSAPAAN